MSNIFIFSGAGLSAESGIPTFRDENGLWENYSVDEIANYKTWRQNKEVVFKFYNERREKLKDVLPNPGHFALAELEKELGKDRCIHFTQNIDDLLERAGCENVVHVHGKACDLKCDYCKHTWSIGYSSVPSDIQCPNCEAEDVKPGVVFFYEPAPYYSQMIEAFSQVTANDVILVIGTSGNVVPMDWIIRPDNRTEGPITILVNKELEALSSYQFNYWLKGNASEILPNVKDLILSKLK